MEPGLFIVLDIGKTNAKLTLWDTSGRLLERAVRTNERIDAGGYTALDAAGIESWMADTLKAFSAIGPIKAIYPVAHGAAAVLVKNGEAALLPLDYEEGYSEVLHLAYKNARDPFSKTGSPSLPDGLNLGRQLFWLEQTHPADFKGATILLWPQYWSWLLTGVATSEVTSPGCHTDLWNPNAADFSDMAKARGWDAMFPPLKRANEAVGTLSPAWAAKTGLSPDVQVYCGIHDSNAALVAAKTFNEIEGKDATILSTGTWFIAMRSLTEGTIFQTNSLPEGRDCLVNIDYEGKPTPTARLMGGREIETLIGIDTRRIDIKPDQPALLAAVPRVLTAKAMVLPTFAQGFGPVPKGRGRWINMPDDWIERRAAVCLYAALMTHMSLDLIGSKNSLLIEGRFAEADVFVRALASLRPDMSLYTCNAHNDVSFGAVKLMNPALKAPSKLLEVRPLEEDISTYAAAWQHDVHKMLEKTA